MYYDDQEEAGVPLLLDIAIHLMGSMVAVAVLLGGPLIALGAPKDTVLLLNIAGGLLLSAFAMFCDKRRRTK